MSAAAVLAMLMIGATTAWAAKPDRSPFTPDPTVLEPGQACAFPVELRTVPGSKYSQTVFSDGRFVISGSGHDSAINLDTDASVTFPTSGTITITDLDSGDQRIRASGRFILFFFAGDQGPFGEVGEDGALYYIQGRADQVLDGDSGLITSIEWGGRATEVCSLID